MENSFNINRETPYRLLRIALATKMNIFTLIISKIKARPSLSIIVGILSRNSIDSNFH